MIYKNKYLSQSFLDNKTIHKVTIEKPLVVLLSTKFTFLNDLIIYSLKLNHVPFQIKQTQQEEVMGCRLPAIAFKNCFHSQQTVIQFIADLMLQRETLIDLTQRKTIGKQQYSKWVEILKQQNTGLCRFSNLKHAGIQTEQDYFNHLFSQFLGMASWIRSDILQRKYEGYRRNEINFQTLLIYDIVKSILKLCEKTKVDHILRANFENLIEFHEEFKIKIERVINAQFDEMPINEIQVVTEKQADAPIVQYKKFSQSWKKFAIILTIATGIYLKWVQ